ncbi:ThuA domain-containing protein [Dyadobacter arcticus]|uniref:Type 1 glutamine amidotransferase n=1 Tax=Dyadobacter arcticus TaxID=1078754 RepID=A0ABX0URI8_9BACT|nr:ThuA domain-containing protein [Dyadobacter arcticus]NIJ54534.1 type 1 glutamine amidotransferase [Dyadobacter arcticus]
MACHEIKVKDLAGGDCHGDNTFAGSHVNALMPLISSNRFSVFWIMIIATAIRCIVAGSLDLGNDEVYYFTYAVQPDLNHFDHPPLVGILIRLFTFNLHHYGELFMRLPAIVGAAINTWLIAKCGKLVRNEKAGIIAAILYNTSIYTSIVSGVFILPDSVQLVFWLLALYAMLQSAHTKSDSIKNKQILWVGFWAGLAIMSKVHGVFLWAGFLGFITFNKPAWLKNPYLYLSVLITAVIISPILIWNMDNDFITWRFHSERVGPTDFGISWKSFLKTTFGQILYNNPFQFVIFILTMAAVLNNKWFADRTQVQLLLWSSLPIILCTTLVSLVRDTLPHWSGPGFVALMILSAAFVENGLSHARGKLYHQLLNASSALILFVILAGLPLIHLYPGTMGKKSFPNIGNGDATLDLYGWDALLPSFKKIRETDIAGKVMSPDAPIVVHKWFPGAHLYYYVAYPLGMNLLGMGKLSDLHKFQWLNQRYDAILPGDNAYYISPSNNFTDPVAIYGDQFKTYEKAATIVQKRNGATARNWFVYRLKNAKGDAPMPESIQSAGQDNVLIFSKTSGFRHKSIEPAIAAIRKACVQNGWDVQVTENAAMINSKYLAHFKVVVFLSTTGAILSPSQKTDFEKYIENGGGYAGIHSAGDTEHHWPWYRTLLGTLFRDHTFFPTHIPDGELLTESPAHPANQGLPARWHKADEWYNFQDNIRGKPGFEVLLSLNEKSYSSIWYKMDGDHPISWTHSVEKGRMFYTALGHNKETFTDDNAMRHIMGGIKWAGKLD